ncbi:MAG: MFS transporter [Chloroflexi bacterium]|nr:MFS transporter [Chloroflexota bacterium]
MSTSYRDLAHVPGFPRLALATLLVRLGAAMSQLALVLFVLATYRSAALAGIAVFLSVAPGIIVSPLAGALLDRHGRVRLMIVDYSLSAAVLAAIVALAIAGALPLWLLLLLIGINSLGNPLGTTGGRTLFPLVVPRHLWDRANAIDSTGYAFTTILGAPLAGVIIAISRPETALAVTALVFVVGALSLIGVREPALADRGTGILREALAGLRYVLGHRSLRSLALSVSITNLAQGILVIALPVLVLESLHGSSSLVGVLWAVMGVSGMASGLVAGRLGSEGRERTFLIIGPLVVSLGCAVLAASANIGMVVVAVVILGLAAGPLDIGLFSLRQRVTDPAWFGRAFAVSMHLNYAGVPIGSAIGGPLVTASVTLAFAVAVGFSLLAAAVTLLALPAGEARPV